MDSVKLLLVDDESDLLEVFADYLDESIERIQGFVKAKCIDNLREDEKIRYTTVDKLSIKSVINLKSV